MKDYSNKEILSGIANSKSSVIRYVYATCYPAIRKLILTNGGNEQDAQDIFQDGIIKVYQKITGHGLQLTCKFCTYLYSVCRFLWLHEIEKKKIPLRKYPDIENIVEDRPANDKVREHMQLRIYEKHFRELAEECQKVLNMYFNKASMEEICVVMGYKNAQIATVKKYRCKKYLMNKIINNPEYKRLKNELYLVG
jgi:RNA polymerase sigma factor (sigma-70 family)